MKIQFHKAYLGTLRRDYYSLGKVPEYVSCYIPLALIEVEEVIFYKSFYGADIILSKDHEVVNRLINVPTSVFTKVEDANTDN